MRRTWALRAALAVCLGLCIAPAAFAAEAPEKLETGLARTWKILAQSLPAGKTVRIAVLDFKERNGGTMALGALAGQRLETIVSNTPNVVLVERGRLEELMKEQAIKQSTGAGAAEGAIPMKAADYIATGDYTCLEDSAYVAMHVCLIDTAGTRKAQDFTAAYDAEVRKSAAYVHLPPKQAVTGQHPLPLPPMELDFRVLGQAKQADGGAREFMLSDGSQLSSGDLFQIVFKPRADCWVYVFLKSSTGDFEALYPYPGITLANRCEGGNTYTLPDPDAGGGRCYRLDNNPGTETLYVVASYEEVKDIKRVIADMRSPSRASGVLDTLMGAIEVVGRGKDRTGSADGTLVINEGVPDSAGQALRGKFAVVKEFRIIHK